MNIDNYKKAFYDNKLPLPKLMELLGENDDSIKNTIKFLEQNDTHDTFNFQATLMQIKMIAYKHLVDAGEINPSEIINLNFTDTNCDFDLGILNGKIVTFREGNWV